MRQIADRCLFHSLFILLASGTFAAAQTASGSISTIGSCSPVVASTAGNVAIDIKCPTTVVTNFSYQVDSNVAQSIAAHFNVTDIAINNFFRQINEENVPPYQVAQRLETLAIEINRLRKDLATISVSGSSSELWSKTKKALDDGDIGKAIDLQQRLVHTSAQAVDSAFSTILDNVRVKRSLGELYKLTYKYDDAVNEFQQAVEMLPPRFNFETARLKMLLAEALYLAGKNEKLRTAALDAVSAAEPIQSLDPEIYLRALGTLLRVRLASDDPQGALTIFSTKIEPLLGNKDLLGSNWAVFCFSCAGKAFIDLHDYEGARKVLEDGLIFANKRVVPDTVSLASIYLNLSVAYDGLDQEAKASQNLNASKKLFVAAFPDENIPDLAYVYVNQARRTTKAKEKEEAYERAFGIVARTLPYTNDTYANVLGYALSDKPEQLQIGATSVATIGEELSDKFYEALYDQHMRNVRSLTQDREKIGRASVDFAASIATSNSGARSIPFYEKTIALYSDGGTGESLAMAQFEGAEMLEDAPGSDSKKVENYYKLALQNFSSLSGIAGEDAQHVRLKLVAFYLKHSNRNAAQAVVQTFERSISTASAGAKRELAELKSRLAKK